MMKFLGAALLALSLSACQNSPSPWYQAYGTTSFPVAKDGMAALYIVRDAAPPDAASIPISMSRNPVGGLAGSTWMRLDLPPNPYDLRAFGSSESTELIITLVAGETRFLLAEPKGTNDAQLMWLSQEDGRELVRKGTQVGSYYNP
ncbi:MAG: hypothetical protein LCH95_09855 [Proteobacteria bacterium]|nr:hypothetical protein [Pseudomonadota bacterium]